MKAIRGGRRRKSRACAALGEEGVGDVGALAVGSRREDQAASRRAWPREARPDRLSDHARAYALLRIPA